MTRRSFAPLRPATPPWPTSRRTTSPSKNSTPTPWGFGGAADFEPRQPYRLVFFGEKTSLDDVLGPLAVEVSADLYLMGGQISDTQLHRIAKDAVADGRPLVVFTFSDFDPSGFWDMPTAIGRKLQALRDLRSRSFSFTVVHAALGPEQVRDLRAAVVALEGGRKARRQMAGALRLGADRNRRARDPSAGRAGADRPRSSRALFRRRAGGASRAAGVDWRGRVQDEIAGQLDEDRLDDLKDRAQARSTSCARSTPRSPRSPMRSRSATAGPARARHGWRSKRRRTSAIHRC